MAYSGRPLLCVRALALGTLVALWCGGVSLAPAPAGSAAAAATGTDGGVRSSEIALREVPGGADGAVVEAEPFSMLGLTWTGAERNVRVRTRSDGVWGSWRRLPLLHDGPDRGGQRSGLTATDLAWVGRSDAVRVRVAGSTPGDLTLVLMQPDGSTAAAPLSRRDPDGPHRKPRLHARAEWGADPGWRTGTPSYNRTIQQMHVHHTVNGNSYAPDDVPGLLRGIYRYHTHHLGWSDIGYNFLVDRFGRIWIGRAGGAARPVQGAHTLGFNSTSFGVAVIGDFSRGGVRTRVVTALVHLAAWKLAGYDRDPAGRVSVYSHGSDRYPAGRTVRLPVIDGHRDTSATACPGGHLYRKLPAIRARAADRIRRFG